jgi:hypothetical protein
MRCLRDVDIIRGKFSPDRAVSVAEIGSAYSSCQGLATRWSP